MKFKKGEWYRYGKKYYLRCVECPKNGATRFYYDLYINLRDGATGNHKRDSVSIADVNITPVSYDELVNSLGENHTFLKEIQPKEILLTGIL